MYLNVDLREIPSPELREELRRRKMAATLGFCSYCDRKIGSKPDCKIPERHQGIDR